MKKLPLRALLPILAAVSFVILSFATTLQTHIIETQGWTPSSSSAIGWGPEPIDIGPPADILLIVLNLPALIALFPLIPLTYWIDSETVLRSAWGFAAVGQWFLIGRYLDARRGLNRDSGRGGRVLLNKVLFGIAMVVGAPIAVMGFVSAASGHCGVWGFAMYASFAFWGSVAVIGALRWRSTSSWAREHLNSLDLS